MSRVLVISPHPDDESIGCGGTLLQHVAERDEVRVIFLTSGEQGGHGRSPAETSEIRESEAAAAAEILDIERIEFWREPDGRLQATREVVMHLTTYLDDWHPHLLYVTHDRELLRDHRSAARIVRRAVLACHLDSKPGVRMYEVWTPLQEMDEIVDISAEIETKIAAIRAHKCQCDVMRFDDAARGLNRYRGEMHSWPGGDYAEVFRRMRL